MEGTRTMRGLGHVCRNRGVVSRVVEQVPGPQVALNRRVVISRTSTKWMVNIHSKYWQGSAVLIRAGARGPGSLDAKKSLSAGVEGTTFLFVHASTRWQCELCWPAVFQNVNSNCGGALSSGGLARRSVGIRCRVTQSVPYTGDTNTGQTRCMVSS